MMRQVFIAGLLLLSGGSLHSSDLIGSSRTQLGNQHVGAAGVSVSFIVPLANAIAYQTTPPVNVHSNDAPIMAAVGEPCRRLHPNKEFESFANIQFEGKRDDSIAREQSVLTKANDDSIADASESIFENGVLDPRPVSNAEYAEFVNQTNHTPPPHWNGNTVPSGMENSPVTNVSYDDAQSFAKWSEKRLPTSNEWMSGADQLSWDLEMPQNEWSAAPNDEERAMLLNRRNGSFADVLRTERRADTTFRLVSPPSR